MKTSKIKLISYLGMIALIASMVVGLLGFSGRSKDIDDIIDQLLKRNAENNINLTMRYITNTYGTLTQGYETLLDSNGESIEGKVDVVDSIKEDLGDEATIFVKVDDNFKRISTSILNDKNERLVGSFLGRNHNAYKSVMNGEEYVGEANIFEDKYYTAYKPIKDENRNVIGLLFVGVPTKRLDNIIDVYNEETDKTNILIIVLRAISLGSLIALVSASVIGNKVNSPNSEIKE